MTMSLRLRLVLIILLPLLAIAMIIGAWAVYDAQQRAEERFDRSLLSAALAVSRDVVISDGDALSPETNALLHDTSGGQVFYHVYAPDGVYVTGYATPPVPLIGLNAGTDKQLYFDGIYQGREVRVLKFIDAMQVEGLSGDFTVTVWQNTVLRNAIVQDLSWRTFRVMTSLVLAVALVVWFGVRFGLNPLLDLEKAIGKRSSDDLTKIKRKVPKEAQGIVHRLNQLFAQVSSTMEAKDAFISNAAHQLRNPIAGVLAMSEAVQSSTTFEDMKERSADLVVASKRASNLANKLLAFERAKALRPQRDLEQIDVVQLISETLQSHQPAAKSHDVELSFNSQTTKIPMACDPLMLGEAVTNLIDNALVHGGDSLGHICVDLRDIGGTVELTVQDDGEGIADSDVDIALERFVQLDQSGGSGLGLPIARAVAQKHGGDLVLSSSDSGLKVVMTLARG